MRKFLLILFMAATAIVYGQGRTLYTVNLIKPRSTMTSAFEASWKLHLDKFHKSDDKRNVYQILSGLNEGAYLFVEGPISYATMDTVRSNSKEHSLDLERNIFSKEEGNSVNGTYRWVDTLSLNPQVVAEKFLVTITHVKAGRMADYLTEVRRGVLINPKVNPDATYSNYVQIWAGTDPVLVTIRNLKDGFKELDAAFNPPPVMGAFRDAYIKEYGQAAWDTRQKMIVDDVNSREVYIMKFRKDLSSK